MSDERWRSILEAIPGWIDPYGADFVPNSQQVEADTLAEIRQRDPHLADLAERWIASGKAMRLRAAWLLSNTEKRS